MHPQILMVFNRTIYINICSVVVYVCNLFFCVFSVVSNTQIGLCVCVHIHLSTLYAAYSESLTAI